MTAQSLAYQRFRVKRRQEQNHQEMAACAPHDTSQPGRKLRQHAKRIQFAVLITK
jgi:hypothetical protein